MFRLIETHPSAKLNRGFAENGFELTDEVKARHCGRFRHFINGYLRVPYIP